MFLSLRRCAMSHEGIRAFDMRSAEEIRENESKRYRDIAECRLSDTGEIGFCGTDEQIRAKYAKINRLARELEERDQLRRLKAKYE